MYIICVGLHGSTFSFVCYLNQNGFYYNFHSYFKCFSLSQNVLKINIFYKRTILTVVPLIVSLALKMRSYMLNIILKIYLSDGKVLYYNDKDINT